MKKVFIGIAGIGLVATAAMPFANGIIAEKAFNDIVTQANQLYADSKTGMRIEVISYDRGFSSSEIDWKLDLGKYKSLYGIDEIIFSESARHGFSGVTSETSLIKNDWYMEAVTTHVAGKDPLHITTNYHLAGDITTQLTLDPFSLEVDGEQVEISPANLIIGCDTTLSAFTSEGTWDGLKVAEVVKFDKMTVTSNLKKITSLIWDGTAAFTLAGITARAEEGVAMEMTDMRGDYAISYDEQTNRIGVAGTYAVGRITSPEKSATDLAITATIDGLDATAYEEAMKTYMDFMGQFMESIAEAGDDQEAMEAIIGQQMMGMGLQMMAVYEKLLKQGFEISIKDVHAKLAEGEIAGSARIALLKDLTVGQMMPMAAQPALLFEYIDLATQLKIPKALAGNAPMLTAPAYPGMMTGIFTEDGDYLQHEARTSDGKLFINGHELEL